MQTPKAVPRRYAGLASVELALVLPVFLMLMMATAEYGRALYQFNTLTKSVRDAAQYLARTCITGGTCNPSATQRQVATNLILYGVYSTSATPTGLTALLPGTTTVTITAPFSVTYVKVDAQYTYPKIFLSLPNFRGGTLTSPSTYTASVTMVGL